MTTPSPRVSDGTSLTLDVSRAPRSCPVAAEYDDAATLAAATGPLAPSRTWIAFLLRITNV